MFVPDLLMVLVMLVCCCLCRVGFCLGGLGCIFGFCVGCRNIVLVWVCWFRLGGCYFGIVVLVGGFGVAGGCGSLLFWCLGFVPGPGFEWFVFELWVLGFRVVLRLRCLRGSIALSGVVFRRFGWCLGFAIWV